MIPILAPGLNHLALPGPLGSESSILIADDRAASRIADAITQTARLLQVTERTGGRRQDMLERFLGEFRHLAATPEPAVPTNTPVRETVTLAKEKTALVRGGSLRITLNSIVFEGSPLRHFVTACLNAPGQATHEITNAEVGLSLTYGGYDVYLVEASANSVVFEVEPALRA